MFIRRKMYQGQCQVEVLLRTEPLLTGFIVISSNNFLDRLKKSLL